MEANPGPLDPSVLYDQDKHVSTAVWEGQERGALRCHEHTSKLGEWRLTLKQIELVEKAGFGYLRKIPAISLDNPLISALVERWRKETNTFHFNVGEMTVTLSDVAYLLGLSIDGKPVIGITHTSCVSVCERLLGRSPDSRYASGGMVKLSWLKEFFSHCPENAPMEVVEQCTRAYLLYLVGSTIFSTTTGNKVPVMYLPLFEDFEESGNYAWGAAALAFLYRALGNACVKTQSTICGCLTLLQCWSYFHLNIGRPKLNRDPIHDHFPFVLRWKGKQSGPTTNRDVVFYRKALDSLKPNDVEWFPYKFLDSTIIPDHIRRTLKYGRSKTMLICFDKAERHLPDRCLRQFLMLQPIPDDVVRWVRKSRGVDGGVDLSGKMESELNEWASRELTIINHHDAVDEIEYMRWYSRITRRVVGRPISLSSEFQRTISGLREISYLADSFSTKGLDGQQFESITRIRYIAQESLRDQVGSPVTPPAASQLELGKRSRGKERIRRKGSLKRRRKDDPMEYYEGSEDDQSQFYGSVIEVDQLQLREAQDVGELHLHQTDDGLDPQQLCLTPDEGNTTDLHGVVNRTDDAPLSNTAGIVNNSEQFDATNQVKESLVSDATMEEVDAFEVHDPSNLVNEPQLDQATALEIHGFEPCYTTNNVNDQELHGATTNEANEPQFADPVKDSKDPNLPDASGEISDLQHYDETRDGNGSLLPERIIADKNSQLIDATEENNGAQLPGAVITDNDSQLIDATEEDNGAQLPGAVITDKDSQLIDATNEDNETQLADSTIEVKCSQPNDDAIGEGYGSKLPDDAEEKGSQLSDSTEEPKDSRLQEVVGKENSQLLTTTDEGKNTEVCDASEERDKQLQSATKEGMDSQVSDTTDARVADPHTTGEANDLQSPDANYKVNDSKPSLSSDNSDSSAVKAAPNDV